MRIRILILSSLAILPLNAVDFVLFTQPKTGTHLLKPILTELSGKQPYCPRTLVKQSCQNQGKNSQGKFLEQGCCCPNEVVNEIWRINEEQGSFIHFHTPYSVELERYLKEKRTVVFFVKRDPRDQIVSLLNHYKKFKFIDKEVEQLRFDDERLFFMIQKRMKPNLRAFMGWLSSPICCVLDFDTLMGNHGEADLITELRKIAHALDLNLSNQELKDIHAKYFGNSNVFLKRKIGSWHDYFSEKHKAAAKKQIGSLLIQLGFEKDLNW